MDAAQPRPRCGHQPRQRRALACHRARGRAVGLVDWSLAGPTDRLDEVAVTGWWTAQLHDDDIAAANGLPDAAGRAQADHARVQRLHDPVDLGLADAGRGVDAASPVNAATRHPGLTAQSPTVWWQRPVRPAAPVLLAGGRCRSRTGRGSK
jgi:hypothetical protein